MNREFFETPEIEVVKFSEEDIVTTSVDYPEFEGDIVLPDSDF